MSDLNPVILTGVQGAQTPVLVLGSERRQSILADSGTQCCESLGLQHAAGDELTGSVCMCYNQSYRLEPS